jgi:hypothetical protein
LEKVKIIFTDYLAIIKIDNPVCNKAISPFAIVAFKDFDLFYTFSLSNCLMSQSRQFAAIMFAVIAC